MTMTQGSDPEDRQAFADFLSVLALSLFGVFAVTALASAVPRQLLNPGWQLRLGTTLIDNGPIAALGVVAAWLAVILMPRAGSYGNRLRAIRGWAIAVALGYLLLIPVQVSAAWRGLIQVDRAERQERRVIISRIATLREIVRRAPSVAALQGPWEAQQGPPLSAADGALPLPQLRVQLLARLQQLSDRLDVAARPDAGRARVWSVVQNTLRLCGSALFLGLGFAAAAQDRAGHPSLLRHGQALWWGVLGSLARRRSDRRLPPQRGRGRLDRQAVEDADYFDQITPRD